MKRPDRRWALGDRRGDDAFVHRMEALDEMRRTLRPAKIHHSTGRLLVADGLATRHASGKFQITEDGIAYIEKEEREERRWMINRSVDKERHDYVNRVMDWLKVHADMTFAAETFARHVANALVLGEVPVPSGIDWEDGDAQIRAWVEAAIDGVEAIRESKRDARVAGGNLVVSYAAGPKITARAKERRRAAVEKATVDQPGPNVASLETFRQKRLA
ncbi:MAG: hypothetical protein ACRDPE_15345 [Solirubrobacterales bacterium]